MRIRFVAAIVPLALVFALASCQSGVAMWGPCAPAANGDASGTDGTYVLRCEAGEWVPVMTADEFARLARGEQVTIAPLPTRPPTTTTSSTTTTTTTAVVSTLVFSNAQDPVTQSNWGYLTGSGLQPGATITRCSDQYGCLLSGVTVDSNGNASHSGAMFAASGCQTNVYFTSTKADGSPITSNTASYPAGTPGCP